MDNLGRRKCSKFWFDESKYRHIMKHDMLWMRLLKLQTVRFWRELWWRRERKLFFSDGFPFSYPYLKDWFLKTHFFAFSMSSSSWRSEQFSNSSCLIFNSSFFIKLSVEESIFLTDHLKSFFLKIELVLEHLKEHFWAVYKNPDICKKKSWQTNRKWNPDKINSRSKYFRIHHLVR